MLTKKLTAVLVIATAVAGFSGVARAQEGTQDDFMLFFKMAMMDKNKDGMVSKAEFLEMMGKVYDMKAKEMKSKGGMMSSEDFKQFLMYLRAGS
jgi:hypothetical protein